MVRKRRGTGRNYGQKLNYPFTFVTSTSGSSTLITTAVAAVSTVRPTKPLRMQLSFFSTTARSFTVIFFGGNGEEILRSPVLMSGPIPRSATFTMPANTDFALYSTGTPVLTVNHATNPSISFTANWLVAHSNPTAGVFL